MLLEIVRYMLETRANVNAGCKTYGFYALSVASYNGHEKVVELLLQKGAKVNAEGGFQRNALSAASFEGHERMVRMLLEQGADVNAKSGAYHNALSLASSNGHEKVVRLLLEQWKMGPTSMLKMELTA